MTDPDSQLGHRDVLALLGRWLRRLLFGLAFVLGTGALVLAVVLWPSKHTIYTDAETINEPAETAQLRDILWQPPVRLPDLINSTAHEYEPRISADGLTLFFVRGKAGANADIYYCRKTPAGWDEPSPLTAINTQYEELGPELSADGQALYFYSDRPGGEGGYDLWVAWRSLDSGSSFGPAVNLGPAVNSEFNDYGAALTRDGETLYFASNRPLPHDEEQPKQNAWPATIREDLFRRTYDLYSASLGPHGASRARPVSVLNTLYNEGAPCVSPFTDFVYFASDRPGGEGAFDLYRTRRVHGRHEAPSNLGSALNTAANELDPGLTMGGYTLYFSSDRPTDSVETLGSYPYHVYRSTSREVFTNVNIQRRTIDWAALWARIGPNLLWALLLLLLLLLFVTLVRDLKGRRLSLLTRCLLASLAMHLLMMMMFNVWKVTAVLASEFRRRGPIQIALVGPTEGADLVAQVRGQFTALELPAPAEMKALPREANVQFESNAALENMQVVHQSAVAQTPLIGVRTAPDARVDSVLDAPALPQQVLERHAQATLKLLLPTDEARVATAEELPATTPEAQPVRAARPNVHTPEPDDSRPTVTAPGVTATAVMPERTFSLARATIPREAEERPVPVLQSQAVAPTVSQPPGLELTMPCVQAQTAHLEEATAQAQRPAPAFLSSTHRGPSVQVAATEEQTLVDTLPTPTLLRITEQSASFAPTQQSAPDSRVSAQATQTQPRAPSLPPANLTLPALDESVSAEQEVPTFAPTGVIPQQMHRKLDGLFAAPELLASRVVEVAPAAGPVPILEHTHFKRAAVNPQFSVTPTAIREAEVVTLPPRIDQAAPALVLALPRDVENPADAIGTIQGRITDAATGEPIQGATIRLDLSSGQPLEVQSGPEGIYILHPPEVPTFFALSASSAGYLPSARNVTTATVMGRTLELDFALTPQAQTAVAFEVEPEVHHLGDNAFEGRINSQFQQRAEGAVYETTFELTAKQLELASLPVELTVLVKGVQMRHQLLLNGRDLGTRLDWSPSDGSFGMFVVEFDPALLRVGTNVFSIRAGSRGNDVDDFEFVNLQINLVPSPVTRGGV